MDGDAAGVGESVSIRRTRALLLNVEIFLGYRGKVKENETMGRSSVFHSKELFS